MANGIKAAGLTYGKAFGTRTMDGVEAGVDTLYPSGGVHWSAWNDAASDDRFGASGAADRALGRLAVDPTAFAPSDSDVTVAPEMNVWIEVDAGDGVSASMLPSGASPVERIDGAIALTGSTLTYTQNFDTLANTAGSTTNTLLPDGWAINETGGSARDNEQYAVDTGGSATGDTYSYGSAGSTDRALGGLQSGTLIPVIGAAFTNTTGAAITSLAISYTGEQWRISNTAAARDDRLDFQISLNATSLTDGTWIDINALDFTNVIKTATAVSALDGNAAANRIAISSTIQNLTIADGATFWIRWTDLNASGADDGLAIDNFSLTATAATGGAGSFAIADLAAANEGTGAGTTDFSFTVTRSGGSAGAVTVPFTVDFAGLTTAANAADFAALTGTVSFADGQTTAQAVVQVNADATPELNEAFRVTLGTPSAGSVTNASATGTIVNDDGTPIQVAIDDVFVAEGNAGTAVMTFTVTRSGGTDAFSVDYGTADGTATVANGDYAATNGTISFAAGEMVKTVTVLVNGDTNVESSETLFVNLSNATNDAIIADGQGVGTITDDDTPLTLISAIQGTSYFSPIVAGAGITGYGTGASLTANATSFTVTVRAVVTAIDGVGARQGFYITEERADWDANDFTSEGIFVMTRNDSNLGTLVSSIAGLAVGTVVTVTANVMEYRPFNTNGPLTVLVNPTVQLGASNQPLPTIVLDAAHKIPNALLTGVAPDFTDSVDDAGDSFDATNYAMSFFETIEGMLVTVPDVRVADGFTVTQGGGTNFKVYSGVSANPEQLNSRGGYTIAGDPVLSPPDTVSTTDDVIAGGKGVTDGDINPDILEIDFSDFAIPAPSYVSGGLISMGDRLGDVTGIVEWNFTDMKLMPTAVGTFVDTTLTKEVTTIADDSRALTFATFNVENLAGNAAQSRFDAIATVVATNLRAPAILSIEEIQDNNGAAAGDGISSTGTDATTTWTRLVAAVNAATGKIYQWVDQAPVYNAEGGEPNGNIRVGFLYDTGRVQLGDLAANAPIEERRKYVDRLGDNVRDAGDLIAYSDNMVGGVNTADYMTTRLSLLGQFSFNGNTVFALANHLPSKGGSGTFWDASQINPQNGTPVNSDWTQRSNIGEDIYTLLNYIQTQNGSAHVLSGGDYNDFYFYRPLETATGYVYADGSARNDGSKLVNLALSLTEAERYTYTFDGRSQAIDHILADARTAAAATTDVVHINSGFPAGNRISDHDPVLTSVDLRDFAETLTGTTGNDTFNGFGGDDLFRLEQGGNDTADGGTGNDGFYFGGSYTAADTVNGGAGAFDQVGLQGDYSGGVTFGSLVGTELVVLLPGNDTRFGDAAGNFYDYSIFADAGTIVSNNSLAIQANTLRAGEDFTFNGSASAINFLIYGGLGVDNLTGGTGNDGFFFGQGRFGSSDVVNGGAGAMDQLGLQGNFNLTFGASQLSGVEYIALLSASDSRFGASGGTASYLLVMNDGNVAAGERLVVQANTLISTETVDFRGGSELDGSFQIFSGAGADFLSGGAMADEIWGGAGNDTISGGNGADTLRGGDGNDILYGQLGADMLRGDAGNDRFVYTQPGESPSNARDQILDFTLGDNLDLSGLGTFFYRGSAGPNGAGQVQVVQAGTAATVNVFIDGDANPDLVINVTVADGHTLTSTDFSGVTTTDPRSSLTDPIVIVASGINDPAGDSVSLGEHSWEMLRYNDAWSVPQNGVRLDVLHDERLSNLNQLHMYDAISPINDQLAVITGTGLVV